MKVKLVLTSLALAGSVLRSTQIHAKQLPGSARNALMKAKVQALQRDMHPGLASVPDNSSRSPIATLSTGMLASTGILGTTSDVSTNVGSPTLVGNSGPISIVVQADTIVTVAR